MQETHKVQDEEMLRKLIDGKYKMMVNKLLHEAQKSASNNDSTQIYEVMEQAAIKPFSPDVPITHAITTCANLPSPIIIQKALSIT